MRKWVILSIISILCVPLLYGLSIYNYPLFHTTIEFFTILVGILIFTIAILSQKYKGDTLTERFGYGLLFVSILVFFHTITYKGINIIEGYDSNIATQFWIALNYLQSISLLLAIFLHKKKLNKWFFIITYFVISTVTVYLCFARIFPDCFIEGKGLTPFKKYSEYIIILIYILCFIGLRIKKITNTKILLSVSIILFIIAEFAFTLYKDVYGIQNFLGHYFRLVGLFSIFMGIVITNIQSPYDMIFSELKILSEKDGLTKLYNRNYLNTYLKTTYSENNTCMVFFDIDNFKQINDIYGHDTGDVVLKKVSELVIKNIRKNDLAFRYGGDEFLVIFKDTKPIESKKIWERINSEIANCTFPDIDLKISVSACLSKCNSNFEDTFKNIDSILYEVKTNGKNMTLYNI